MLEYLEIGIISNTHGVKGELKIMPLTDDPKRYNLLENVLVEDSKKKSTLYKVNSVRFYNQFVLMTLEGIDNMNKAEALKGCKLVVHRENAIELPENTYFIGDLLDCYVYEADVCLGRVDDIISSGANDVYVIKNEKTNKELLIPAISQIIKNIDIENCRIDAIIPKGLKDL